MRTLVRIANDVPNEGMKVEISFRECTTLITALKELIERDAGRPCRYAQPLAPDELQPLLGEFKYQWNVPAGSSAVIRKFRKGPAPRLGFGLAVRCVHSKFRTMSPD